MSEVKKVLVLLLFILIIAIIGFFNLNKEDDEERKYFSNLNFTFTGLVKKVEITNEHDYGVIYVSVIQNNKGSNYEALFKGKYLFCKIRDSEALIVSPEIDEIQPGDTIVINTNQLKKYSVYRKGKLVDNINPWINSEDYFYDYLQRKDYLNFGHDK